MARSSQAADTGITLIPNESNLFLWRALLRVRSSPARACPLRCCSSVDQPHSWRPARRQPAAASSSQQPPTPPRAPVKTTTPARPTHLEP